METLLSLIDESAASEQESKRRLKNLVTGTAIFSDGMVTETSQPYRNVNIYIFLFLVKKEYI